MLVWHNGKLIRSEERDREGDRRIEKLNDCEQYSLRAVSSGWYPCSHCQQKLFWLNKDEVAKYGHICNIKEQLIYAKSLLHVSIGDDMEAELQAERPCLFTEKGCEGDYRNIKNLENNS